jgi:hypothetical protein
MSVILAKISAAKWVNWFNPKNGICMVFFHIIFLCRATILESEAGVNGALNCLFSRLNKRDHKMLYGTSITLESTVHTSRNLYMDGMKSYISLLEEPCAGITSSTVFLGQEGTCFNLHIEDCAFEIVNRHVAGAPKVW